MLRILNFFNQKTHLQSKVLIYFPRDHWFGDLPNRFLKSEDSSAWSIQMILFAFLKANKIYIAA